MQALSFSSVVFTLVTVVNAYHQCLRPPHSFQRASSSLLQGTKIGTSAADLNLFLGEKDKCNDVTAAYDEKWNNKFILLKQFQKREGHCKVPPNHIEDGKKLGSWLNNQRNSRKKGTLDILRISRLEEVGVVWYQCDEKWNNMFGMLKQFKEREGHCNVPSNHIEEGKKLGIWLNSQRKLRKEGTLDTQKKTRLDELAEEVGVVWDHSDEKWNNMFGMLKKFQEREGHCDVPRDHIEEGQNLGTWLNTQRQLQKKGTLDIQKETRLEELSIVWDSFDERWNIKFLLLKQFQKREGHCNIPQNHTEEGHNLWFWLYNQRNSRKKGTLDALRMSCLEEVGVVYHTEEGHNLGFWLYNQRNSRKKGTLDALRMSCLEEVGVVWDHSDEKWNNMFGMLKKFQEREGHCDVPRDHIEEGQNLGTWFSNQRQRKETLGALRMSRLEEVGVTWYSRAV
eukprot:CAMPEP_0194228792 /NCGR_PEP_ID=MMETSP0156-20130528/43555_1 /TAXON_ID=33649 /ORGANISM="Thalassionema nitzschioides, Strain L26-B" /LENGTH=450 /DNA_ID=CAMNT_0038961313 /DNA_START=65 /DNA_END=1418 /DNA_ORIENTATION=+